MWHVGHPEVADKFIVIAMCAQQLTVKSKFITKFAFI